MFGSNTYKDDVALFEKIFSAEADDLLSKNHSVIIYIGRETCPYCRKFAKKLSGLTNEINKTIYYVDSEDFSDDTITAFRQKYNVVTVPGFIVNKNNEIDVRCDSSLPEDEILQLTK